MNILIVDDSLERQVAFQKKFYQHSVTIAKNYNEAISCLNYGNYNCLFLDHDLGEGKTGYDVAVWIEKGINQTSYPGRVRSDMIIYVHSMNPIGARNIQRVFPDAILCPGAWQSPDEGEGTGE